MRAKKGENVEKSLKFLKLFNFASVPFNEFSEFRKKAPWKCTSIVELYFKNNLITQIATQRLTNGERQPYRFYEISKLSKNGAVIFSEMFLGCRSRSFMTGSSAVRELSGERKWDLFVPQP